MVVTESIWRRNRASLLDALVVICAIAVCAHCVRLAFYDDALLETGAARAGVIVARAARVTGDVQHRPSSSLVWRSTRGGDPLHEGDAVFVPADAELRLRGNDDSEVTVVERTLVLLPAPRGGSAWGVDLKRGSVVAEAGAGAVVVVGSAGEARLEPGAAAEVTSSMSGELSVRLERGSGRLSTASRSVALAAGDEWSAAGSAPPTHRQHTLHLEQPRAHARVYSSLPARLRFRWRGEVAAKALPLVIELRAEGAAPGSVALSAEIADASAHEVELDIPVAGRYRWRLRGAGRGGATSAWRMLHLFADEPPLPIGPMAGSLVAHAAGRGIRFAWSHAAPSSSYRVEVRPAEGTGPALESVTKGARHVVLRGLPPGRYGWRVTAADRGRQELWSELAYFSVGTGPSAPATEDGPASLHLEPLPSTTTEASVVVEGAITTPSAGRLFVAGTRVEALPGGRFRARVPLTIGDNAFELVLEDVFGARQRLRSIEVRRLALQYGAAPDARFEWSRAAEPDATTEWGAP